MLKLAPIKESHKSILKISLHFIVSFAISCCNYFAYLFQKVQESKKERERIVIKKKTKFDVFANHNTVQGKDKDKFINLTALAVFVAWREPPLGSLSDCQHLVSGTVDHTGPGNSRWIQRRSCWHPETLATQIQSHRYMSRCHTRQHRYNLIVMCYMQVVIQNKIICYIKVI